MGSIQQICSYCGIQYYFKKVLDLSSNSVFIAEFSISLKYILDPSRLQHLMDCEVTTGKASCPLAAGYLYLLRRYNPPEPTNLYPLLLHTVIDFPGGYVAESQFSQPLSNPTIQYAVYTVYSNPTNSIDQSIDQVYLQGPSHLQPLTSQSLYNRAR